MKIEFVILTDSSFSGYLSFLGEIHLILIDIFL